jgi:excisionase family DNA binding protein
VEIREHEVYTQRETQELLKVSASTVTRMIKKGLIRTAKVGKQYRILGKELLRILSPELEDTVGKAYNKARNWAHAEDPHDSRPRLLCLLGRKAGLSCLNALLHHGSEYRVAGLFTHRYLPRSESPVKKERPEYAAFEKIAKLNGIPFTALDGREEAASLPLRVEKTDFDYLVSCGWRFHVPPAVLIKAHIGSINLHRGKLPRFAGAEPVRRALEAGEKTVTLTAHEMTDDIDAGEIIAEKTVPARVRQGESSEKAVERVKTELLPLYPEVLFESLRKLGRKHA